MGTHFSFSTQTHVLRGTEVDADITDTMSATVSIWYNGQHYVTFTKNVVDYVNLVKQKKLAGQMVSFSQAEASDDSSLNKVPTHIATLATRLTAKIDDIERELIENKGRKKTHWAWWIFPTSKEGASEPLPSTKVENETDAMALLACLDSKTCDAWLRVLKSVKLVPTIDRGRVLSFIREWSTYGAVQTVNPRLYDAIISLKGTVKFGS